MSNLSGQSSVTLCISEAYSICLLWRVLCGRIKMIRCVCVQNYWCTIYTCICLVRFLILHFSLIVCALHYYHYDWSVSYWLWISLLMMSSVFVSVDAGIWLFCSVVICSYLKVSLMYFLQNVHFVIKNTWQLTFDYCFSQFELLFTIG